MSKLTDERCRQLISQLSFERDNHGMSNQKYDYLEALEIALPVLERQEKGEDSWLHWNGEMALPPVDSDVRVEVKQRNGEVTERQAKCFAWRNSPVKSEFDIIAYRVIENDGREG